jgi:hypothetical protein
MALKGGFSRITPLQLALERGMRPGAKLGDELGQLGEYSIKAKSDAEAVCRVLARCVHESEDLGGEASLQALIALFQEVEGRNCPAFLPMVEVGLPLLVDLVDAGCEDESSIDPDDVLFALKILVIYGTSAGTDAVIRAAQRPFQPDLYWWHLILQPYGDGHPETGRLFQALSNPLPEDFLAVSLLDCANTALNEGAGHEHPFDNDAGKRQLERWLTDHDRGHLTYAVSAAAALPYISGPRRDRLLAIALDHASDEVQLEAAYASAKLGRDSGIQRLARFCLNVDRAEKARQYLGELSREDVIPPEALDPDFCAKAEFSQWLAHPNELGRPPDVLEIVDRRDLVWPPELERKTLWLIKYLCRDTSGLLDDVVGVGLVGSVTFCLSGDKLELRPPEDSYAAHCYWELEARGYITVAEVEHDSTEYDGMLRQITLGDLARPRIIRVVEIAPELKYPQRLIALARTMRNGDEGWVVVDGPRSRWYAASDTPGDPCGRLVVMIHVGRVLLGSRNGFHASDRPL